MAASSTFPLLCFAADDTAMALAADEVIAVEPANPTAPYVGSLLDVGMTRSLAQQRSLWLGRGATVFELVVDNPVRIERCAPEDILPLSPGIPLDRWRPVMGFAKIRDVIILLLDSESLIRALTNGRRGGKS